MALTSFSPAEAAVQSAENRQGLGELSTAAADSPLLAAQASTATLQAPITETYQTLAPVNLDQVQELNRWGAGAVQSIAQVGTSLLVRTPFDLSVYPQNILSRPNPGGITPAFTLPGIADYYLSPDRQQILTTYPLSTTVKIWDLADGKLRRALEHAQELPTYRPASFSADDYFQVRQLAYAPDGGRLAVGYGDNQIGIYSAQDGRLEQILGNKLAPRAEQIAFSEDGKYLASSDSVLAWWRLEDGKLLYRLPYGGHISARPFSPDNKRFVSFDRAAIYQRSFPSGELLDVLRLTLTNSVEYSQDGKYLILDGGQEVRRADNGRLLTAEQAAAVLETPVATPQPAVDLSGLRAGGHFNGLQGAMLSPAGNILAYGIQGQQAYWWDVQNSDVKQSQLTGQPLNDMAAQAESGQFAVCIAEGLNLFPRAGEAPQTLERCRKSGTVAFAPDGKTLARAWGTIVKLASLPGGRDEHNLLGHEQPVTGVVYAPDNRLIATGSQAGGSGGELFIWRTEPLSSYRRYRLSMPLGDALTRLAFSPDLKLVAAGGETDKVSLVRVDDGTQLARLRVAAPVGSLAFSPDGGLLAAGDSDGRIYIWHLSLDWEPHMLEGHRAAVTGLEFSTDNSSLLSVSQDGTVRLWGIP